MTSKSKRKIAIVGGGIAGASTAVLLRKHGYDCTVYEQAPEIRYVGAGINFAPNATRCFLAHGLSEKALGAGIRPRLKTNREWDTDETFYTVDIPALAETYGSPFLAFHRANLHNLLASELPADAIQMGKRLRALDRKNGSITLSFEDGTSTMADAVIGTDGLHSRVRAAILGDEPPEYFGHVAYRAIFPTSALPDYDMTDHLRWWAPTSYVLAYKMTEARDEVNIVAGRPEEWDREYFLPHTVSTEALLAAFEGYHPNVQAVLRQCAEVSRWPMMVRPSRLPWSDGAVTLMGDAAHPMTPHLGQGGGMAIEDSVMLARCVAAVNGEDLELAFRLYEQNRFERTAKVQAESRRNLIGRGGASQDWLYEYDINTAPISGL